MTTTPNDIPETTALARQQSAEIVSAVDPETMADAIRRYAAIQAALDKALPGCLMKIQGRPFRKKSYWRAIGTAFNVKVDFVSEVWTPLGEDWMCAVIYVATAPNGRTASGDGACSFSEKVDRDGRPTNMATPHGVRAHAHTRAANRAISNLVGFGEVSAEEVNRRGGHDEDEEEDRPRSGGNRAPEPMTLEAFRSAIGAALGGRDMPRWTQPEVAALLASGGATKASDVLASDRAEVVGLLRAGPPKGAAPAAADGHHPSWEEDRKRFCATLGAAGLKYDDVKAWCAANNEPKPSAMTTAQRDALFGVLATDKGRADFAGFLAVGGK